MGFDSTGYSAPSIVELQTNMSASAKEFFGVLFDTSADSSAGHFIGVTSIEIAKVFEDLLELYTNLNPATAEGRMLENLALLGGLIRKNKAFTTGIVTFYGTNGTVIPEGTVLSVSEDVTRKFVTRYEVTIPPSGEVRVRVIAQKAGAIYAPAGTLTELDDIIAGVDSVTNIKDLDTGTDTVETDAQLRARRNNTITVGGNGTPASIRASLEQIDGVTSVRVINNDTFFWQTRGISEWRRPPKSIECVVEGGDELDIIETIALTKSASTESFGMTTASYQDITGNLHQIRYTRPELVDITVSVVYKVYSEEVFPTDGEQRIVSEILAFAEQEYILGKDVIRDRLYTPIFKVAGISNVTVLIGRGDALPVEDLSGDNIPLELYERAVLSTANIYVDRS